MSETQLLSDLNDSPESSSAPLSRARQHGAKHRDYPASRLQARERARQRVQRAIQEERERARRQAENWRAAGPASALDTAEDAQRMPETAVAAPALLSLRPSDAEHEFLWPRVKTEPPPAAAPDPQLAEESAPETRYSSGPAEDSPGFGWLNPQPGEMADHSTPHAPADTLQGVRDRLASRWFALKGMLEGAAANREPQTAQTATAASAAPVLAVFSLAGGVGKTSLVATLARTLSARGERVLLIETASFGMLPFFFGARERQFGVLRTFAPPEAENDAPVQMISLDADSLAVDGSGQDPLADEISRCAQTTGRVIVDIATASAAVARRVLRMAPMVLVPVVPDMNSVVNVGFIDCLFQRKPDSPAPSSEVYYVLNQFDPSQPLHLDVREVLRERLGDRLLPFTLRRAPAVSEALAEGMTVIDYAPASPIADDFNSLAAWLKARSAPAGAAARGMRWMEK